jgi:hypothetical protein
MIPTDSNLNIRMLLMEQNNVRDRINQFRVQIRREEVAKTLGRSRV